MNCQIIKNISVSSVELAKRVVKVSFRRASFHLINTLYFFNLEGE